MSGWVEVLTAFGLVRYFVLFVIDIGTRRVQNAGITCQLSDAWMKQSAHNPTAPVDGFLVERPAHCEPVRASMRSR